MLVSFFLMFDVRVRRSGEAAKGAHKRSLWAVPLDGMVRQLNAIIKQCQLLQMFCKDSLEQ